MNQLSAAQDFLLDTYHRLPLSFTHGCGCILYDQQGKAYLDFLAGIGVSALGHGHPALVQVIAEQAGQLIHCSNYYHIPGQSSLAAKLCQPHGLAAAFFCNSGAEANEAAFKLARLYQSKQGRPHAYQVVSLQHSFHGRTLATLAANGSTRFHCKFQPLPQGFVYWPAELSVFEQLLDETYAAVIVEVLQGESGVRQLDPTFLSGLEKLCRQRGVLLIADEVQAGMGRTGRFYAYQHFQLQPDLVTLAKGLAGGVPVGALLAREHLLGVLEAGDHGSTFGGNPLAMAAANKVVEIISQPQFLAQVEQKGRLLQARLAALAKPYSLAVRGLGLMCALYSPDGSVSPPQWQQLLHYCCQHGLLVNIAGSVALRLLPPLIVSEDEIEQAVRIIGAGLEQLLG